MNIKEAITKDIREGFTFDLPMLRYFGEEYIPVFLWDNIKDYSDMQSKVAGFDSNFYRFMHLEAVTKNKFLPWYNLNDYTSDREAYCLEESFDLDFLELPEYTTEELLPIKGKLAGFTLEGLCMLDRHYENEYSYGRVMIEVVPVSHYKEEKPIKAYAYMNTLEDIAIEDMNGKWKLQGGMDLVPFAKTKDNKYYKM